jgi:peptidase M23-like protein
MRIIALAAVLSVISWFGPSIAAVADGTGGGPSNSVFPLQLATTVPFAPTAFRSAGASHLVYELHLTNFSGGPVNIRRIEVQDVDAPSTPIAVFQDDKLSEMLDPVGGQAKPGPVQLAAGASTIAYMWVTIKDGDRVPARLSHHITTDDNALEGAVVSTRGVELPVLSPPVRGEGWMASDGPSNDRGNHHRRGVLVLDGKVVDSRRYAIDWMISKNGKTGSGERNLPSTYFAFEQRVYAVADAIVSHAKDGQPDNVPALPKDFHPAVPITMDTVAGNNIVLDLGHGRYAYYFHLHPGSVLVKPGDHVRRGQLIGHIGCSGDATVPHLHFEITTSPKLIAGEGLPYEIDQYRVRADDGSLQLRKKELPLDKMIVDFGPAAEAAR